MDITDIFFCICIWLLKIILLVPECSRLPLKRCIAEMRYCVEWEVIKLTHSLNSAASTKRRTSVLRHHLTTLTAAWHTFIPVSLTRIPAVSVVPGSVAA